MPAERAGYTVTMFLIDTSPSMGKTRTVELPHGSNGEQRTTEMTNLEWSLQFVKLKIQEMIFNGRKTDQCGVIVFGSEGTDNIINDKNGGYEHVTEYIPIAQPNAGTLAKIDALEPSTVAGDPIDALIVGIETQHAHLANKKTWTRKIVLVTDGENPIEIEDWEATVAKMADLDIALTIVGVDFDDDEYPFYEEEKSEIKAANETFFKTLTDALPSGVLGTCALALRETNRPDIKQTKSTLMGTLLRLGDVDGRPDEAIEISIKTCKCTSLSRPKGWKKFARRDASNKENKMEVDEDPHKMTFAQLKMRTEYYIDQKGEHNQDEDEDEEMDEEERARKLKEGMEKVEKEQLVRGFKYGSTYAPCPDGQFPRLPTKKGIDICGFFRAKNFRRELSLGEIQYVWADPASPQQQVALSSIVRAMYEKDVMAIARWVTKDGMDPKMGVLAPTCFDEVDCLLWAQMPFADDVRKYTFSSLDRLVSKKGEVITNHPYLPTEAQLKAMDKFVDDMDLMEAGEKDEEGNRAPWFNTLLSYNPAIHRTKQALFHSAVVSNLDEHPLPPPHPELLKYFEPPKKVLKRAREATEECRQVFKVREVPKKVAKTRNDGHVHARDDENEGLLLDRKQTQKTQSQAIRVTQIAGTSTREAEKAADSGSDTEADSDSEMLLLDKKPMPAPKANLPTPERSLSPEVDPMRAPGRIIGSTHPLADFRKNIAQGDIVSKAVEDLGAVIKEIVMRPFSHRRSSELLDCMKAFRDVALKEDEIESWNEFIVNLKQSCFSEPGNRQFWSEVQKLGRCISLISDKEAADAGGSSHIPEHQAQEFTSK